MTFWHAYLGRHGGGQVAISVYHAILTAVHASLVSLAGGRNLPYISPSNVKLAKVLNERETVFPGLPGLMVLPLGNENMPPTEGTNWRDDIGYPVAILILDQERQQSYSGRPAEAEVGTQDQEFRYNVKLLWRQQIRRHFINQRIALTGVNESVMYTNVEPGAVVSTSDWLRDNIWMSVLVLRCWVREQRGSWG